MSKCVRCGEDGPHFVPPCFGETGFFICDPNDGPRPSRTPDNYVMPCGACAALILPGQTWVSNSRFTYAHQRCNDQLSGSAQPGL